ncbi:MAG TPA: hypothetical protein VJ953_14185 [Saprospiraceae bacterium]|nr:hypothetical protein [Saprospiraceae bacterium]
MAKEKKLPDWLEGLQANSWQIELLIAGGVVITLYQLPDYFRRYFILTYETVGLTDFVVLFLLSVYLLTRLLLIGFFANLLLRSVWVAYIGIYSSYPQGINDTPRNFKAWYLRQKALQPSIRYKLERLDRACNTTFSLAILLCLISLSVIILMSILFFVIGLIPFYSFLDTAWFKYSAISICILLVMGVFERFSFWLFRNRPRAQNWSFRIFRFFDYITLAFLYKGAWLTLVSNIKAWKIQALVIVYFLAGLLLSINQIGDYLKSNGFFHYDILEQRDFLEVPTAYRANYNDYYNRIPQKKSFSLKGCIERDVIKDRYVWVFVSYWKGMDRGFRRHLSERGVPLDYGAMRELEGETAWDQRLLADSLYKQALADYISVQIDGQPMRNVQWFDTQLEKTTEKGFIAYIDTDSLSAGNHIMEIRLNDYNWRGEAFVNNWMNIPFWKE